MTGTEPITVFKVNIGVFLPVRKIKNKAKSKTWQVTVESSDEVCVECTGFNISKNMLSKAGISNSLRSRTV